VLLAHGVDVRLVVTHRDNPAETIWFGSVARVARDYGIETIVPDDPNAPEVLAKVRQAAPEFLFSFYYRQMLSQAMLEIAPRGAFNMHGSLLPRYRGRVPVNWAVLHGERETGATLHAMTVKPDRGAIVDQQAVPILPDDTASEVFDKVTVAAEMTLDRCLPALLDGTARFCANRISPPASYFGGRKPEDGRIDWRWPGVRVHNLVRAVAPPYPGAFCDVAGRRLDILGTWDDGQIPGPATAPILEVHTGRLRLTCADGKQLTVLAARLDGAALTADNFATLAGTRRWVIATH